MSKRYRIRPATGEDRDVIVTSNRSLARETEGHDLDEPTVAAGVAALLADPKKGRYFLAEFEDDASSHAAERKPAVTREPAGQLMVTLEWSDWRNGPIWWIQSVYVSSQHRRRGVYRALHEHVQQAARAAGAVGLRLYVDQDNAAAQATYRSVGMEESRYRMYEATWG
ncbi:MAG: GNAT family N-acetyltransferase [Gemmatimonadota bacterium]